MYVTVALLSEREGIDGRGMGRKDMRFREYHPSATDTLESVQTFRKGRVGRFKTIEGLRLLERGAGEGRGTAYLVQMVDDALQVNGFAI